MSLFLLATQSRYIPVKILLLCAIGLGIHLKNHWVFGPGLYRCQDHRNLSGFLRIKGWYKKALTEQYDMNIHILYSFQGDVR